jgi:mRNA interferase MazF
MTAKRGEVWLADLNPIRGSEQAGMRPVLVFQNDAILRFGTTIVAIPFTTNLRRAALPTCFRVAAGEGGLTSDSVALCHQIRALDTTRMVRHLGTVSEQTLIDIEACVLFTLGIV